MAKIIGIDVSEHNGVVNWPAVKKAGIDFAVIRSGYGTSHVDKQFAANMAGAAAQGIPIGIYHFSYALTEAGARQEAEYVIKLLAPYKGKITLPVFFDFEYDTVDYAKKKGVTLGKEAFNAHTVAFCEAIQAAGYTAGVYYNLDYLRNYVDIDRVGKYVQWFAQYASTPSATGWGLWQYSSSYTIPGCSGRFDVNQADSSIFGGKYAIGWHQDSKGWWYADSATTYCRDKWARINDKWYYFDKEGYMMSNTWRVEAGGDTYYLGEDGAMVTNADVRIGGDGKLTVMPRVMGLDTAPEYAQETLKKLVDKGILKGTSEGDVTVDLGLDTVRALVLLDRAGMF